MNLVHALNFRDVAYNVLQLVVRMNREDDCAINNLVDGRGFQADDRQFQHVCDAVDKVA